MRAPVQTGHHHPHRAAGSALSVGRRGPLRRTAHALLGRGRHRQRPGFRRGQAGRARRSAMPARAKAAIWSSPTSRKARAACAICRRSTGSANISITSRTPADLVKHDVFTFDEYQMFQKAEAFLWNVRGHLHYPSAAPRSACSFDVQPDLAAAHGLSSSDDAAQRGRTVHARLLPGGQGCRRPDAHLLRRAGGAEQEAQAVAGQPAAGLPASRAPGTRISMSRTAASMPGSNVFRNDPVNLIRIFHVADAKAVDVHPHALRNITRSLDLITDAVLRQSGRQPAVPRHPDLAPQIRRWRCAVSTRPACWAPSFRNSAASSP